MWANRKPHASSGVTLELTGSLHTNCKLQAATEPSRTFFALSEETLGLAPVGFRAAPPRDSNIISIVTSLRLLCGRFQKVSDERYGHITIYSFSNNRHHVLVGNNMAQPDSLGHMPCASSPHHGVFERLFQRAMHLITHFFYGGVIPNDQSLVKVRRFPFSVFLLAWPFRKLESGKFTAWYRSSSTAILANTSLPHPECQGPAHSS